MKRLVEEAPPTEAKPVVKPKPVSKSSIVPLVSLGIKRKRNDDVSTKKEEPKQKSAASSLLAVSYASDSD